MKVDVGEKTLEFRPRFCEYTGKLIAWEQYITPAEQVLALKKYRELLTPMVLSTKVISRSGKISKRMLKELKELA
jgi:hypothetical protein